jgi:hypothetical protein
VNSPTAFHQLGRFIFLFQHTEAALTELLALIAGADDEFIRILVNDLEYAQRVKATGVLFARFLDIREGSYEEENVAFVGLWPNYSSWARDEMRLFIPSTLCGRTSKVRMG